MAKLKPPVKSSKEICAICIITVLLLEARREIIIPTDVCFKDIVKFEKLLLLNWWSRKIMLETGGNVLLEEAFLLFFQFERRRTIEDIFRFEKLLLLY